MQAAKLFGWVDKPTSEPGFWIPSPDFADCGLRSVCCHLLHWKLSYTRGTGVCECIWQIHMYLLSAATCPTNWLTFRRLKPGCPLCATWSQFDLNVWHFHLAFPGHISYQALNWGFLPVHGILKSPGFKGQPFRSDSSNAMATIAICWQRSALRPRTTSLWLALLSIRSRKHRKKKEI